MGASILNLRVLGGAPFLVSALTNCELLFIIVCLL